MTAPIVVSQGKDTRVVESRPGDNFVSNAQLAARAGTDQRSFILLTAPVSGIAGKTIVSAPLSVPLVDAIGQLTVTVEPIAVQWAAGRVTWGGAGPTDRRPPVRPQAVTATVGPLPAGARMSIDIATLVQQVANGVRDFGYRVSTTSTTGFKVHAYDSSRESWQLTVSVSEAVDQPTQLSPQGVVSVTKPPLRFVFGDLAAEESSIDGLQVQIDPAANWAAPAWDSGQVATTTPFLNLATTAYPGPTTAQRWRVRAISGGEWSEWSEDVGFDYEPQAPGTITSPTTGDLYDPTTTIEATWPVPLVQYRVLVTGPAGDVRYDSGDLDLDAGDYNGVRTLIRHPLPLTHRGRLLWDGEGDTVEVAVLALDRVDRVPATGVPAESKATRMVTLRSDATVAPVRSVVATQDAPGAPFTTVRWTRSEAADAWEIARNGTTIAVVDHDDPDGDYGPVTTVAAGVWEWADDAPRPWTDNAYTVRAITRDGSDVGHRSKPNPVTEDSTVHLEVHGIWLIPPTRTSPVNGWEAGHPVVLTDTDANGSGLSLDTKDRRTTHQPPQVGYDIDIITAFEGYSGTLAGIFDESLTDEPAQALARARMRAIKANATTPVRVVAGTISAPFLLRDIHVAPDGALFLPAIGPRQHQMRCGLFQCDEFDVVAGVTTAGGKS